MASNLYVLTEFAKAEISTRYNKLIKEAEESEEGLKRVLQWENRHYIKNERQQLIKFLAARRDKEIKTRLEEIESVKAAPDFSGRLVLTVDWKKSRMWRANPRVHTNYGFIGSSIGGCGYDKLSTATAEALNADKRILKLMYSLKDDALRTATEDNQNDINRRVLGYGSGYGVLPRFEGGVGVRCHQEIIEKLGLKWDNISSTDSTDVYIIER